MESFGNALSDFWANSPKLSALNELFFFGAKGAKVLIYLAVREKNNIMWCRKAIWLLFVQEVFFYYQRKCFARLEDKRL